jgi:hypothetical protein
MKGNVEGRDQWGANDANWEFFEIKLDRFAQIGERDLDRLALRGRSRLGIKCDEAAFFGRGQDGGDLHGGPFKLGGSLLRGLPQRQSYQRVEAPNQCGQC